MFHPTPQQNLISTGNETLDRFLGGGFLNTSVNLFERDGLTSRIVEIALYKTLATTTLTKKSNLVYVNCDSSIKLNSDDILSKLPFKRAVNSDVLYKDVRDPAASSKINIAWRYSQRSLSSPSDSFHKINQVDFGLSLKKEVAPESLGIIRVLNLSDKQSFPSINTDLYSITSELRQIGSPINVIIKDVLHPFSPFIDNPSGLISFLYMLRCMTRKLEIGATILCYDLEMCQSHQTLKHRIYNIVDSVVSIHGYETDENKLTGYKDIDGTLNYLKVPKINSFSIHFFQDLSDWGFRFTKNQRFFVIDELSLPPSMEGADSNMQCKTNLPAGLTKIDNNLRPLFPANPLDQSRDVARGILSRKLT